MVKHAFLAMVLALGGLVPAHSSGTPTRPCTDLEAVPGALCGSITVPLDRADPRAGTTTVAFALLPRRDRSRPSLGTIVPNPGGPGTSTIDLAGDDFAGALAPILDRRDLLLIDPRGVGRSDPFSCPALAGPDVVFQGLEAQRKAIGDCGRQLGARHRYYGTAAVADDFDDVRRALGLDRLDLFGVSYGTYLMAVYAQRHPAHVRSVLLAGAYAVNVDTTEGVAATALRRAITLVCERSRECDGRTVLADLGDLAAKLRRKPTTVDVEYRDRTHRVVLDEWALAGAVAKMYSTQPDRDAQLGLARAVAAARHGDLAPIRDVVATHLASQAATADAGPLLATIPGSWATSCHDYPRAFDFSDSLAERRRDYERHLARLDPKDFAPFSPRAWATRTDFDSGACLRWPDDPTARSPFRPGARLPGVPVLVLSGDLDANTPTASGHAAAAQFPHAREVEVADAGHTPAQTPEGARLAMEFIVSRR
ncbi:alpha/beta hydrolase [Actinoplanes sp. NBRC 103695]|uniref:alpha/beta hydrolase n=1 Tax=Actinoplanes sp. NBRC 103695 TaxID=3032202 RepID=UPI0024A3441E|nr:alpha/beta hydrolase [Actinoplanes sp. NBRC 103695]GLZ00481.1 peptidase [Actinoplanes sp. NBRC 103695]